ncbi:MAG TPA: NDP-sugar synthase [Abditibacteriaceae bacterium]|jgi:mannose-1-phosphate guanylyltransferase
MPRTPAPLETAILLAGGEGVRLRPLTDSMPKPLAPVGNAPMMAQILHGLKQQHFKRVALATGYKADLIQDELGDGARCGITLRHIPECQPLGSAGALRNVCAGLPRWNHHTLLVAGADILHDIQWDAVLQTHRASQALVTMICVEVDNQQGFGICELTDDDRVTAFYEKPPPGVTDSRWANAALWLFEPQAIAQIAPRGFSMIETDLLPRLVAQGEVSAHRHRGYWLDVGTPERYLQANLDALDARFSILPGANETEKSNEKANWTPPFLIGPNCDIADDAHICRSVIGANVTIGARAILDECVILDGATIGADAVLRRCVVGGRNPVAAGASLLDTIIA